MAPSVRTRPSPFDRFTQASPSAVASGFSAAMALGPQPKTSSEKESTAESGSEWLRDLQHMTGFYGDEGALENSGINSGVAAGGLVAEDGLSDEEDAESDPETRNGKKRTKTAKGKNGSSKSNKRATKVPDEDSATAQRKVQNRLAQREFRQRKQQYIRALEARVELLSSDHDTQVDRLRYALRGLLAENNQLRVLVGAFASFVSMEKVGGPLQKTGMSRTELEELIEGSAEKVMTEAWQNWPGATECEALRQIRVELKLPPEGLPESNKLSEQAIANTKAKNAAKSSSIGKPSSASSPPERRLPREQQMTTQSAVTAPNVTAPNVTAPNVTAPINVQAESSTSKASDARYGLSQSPVGYPQVSSTSQESLVTPPFSFASGVPNFGSPSAHESNGLMAGLFGSNISTFSAGTPSSQNFPFVGVEFGSPPVVDSGNTPDSSSISQVADTEETRRINAIIVKLRREYEHHGTGKSPSELDLIGSALHQMSKHMSNFRKRPSYQLPRVLQPLEIQQTRAHDPLVDILPYPSIRQNLIAQQDNLVIDDVVLSIIHYTKMHQGDIMDEECWELAHGFLIAYPQLIDKRTLDISNRWRASRNEQILTFDDIAP